MGFMTVAELIEDLKKLPPDMPLVSISECDGGYIALSGANIVETDAWTVGLSGNLGDPVKAVFIG